MFTHQPAGVSSTSSPVTSVLHRQLQPLHPETLLLHLLPPVRQETRWPPHSPPPAPVLLQGRTGERVRSSRWVCVFVVYCSRKWPSREEEEKNSCSWTTTFIKNSGRNQPIRSQPAPDGHKTFYETEFICNFILFDGHDAGFMLFFWI